MNPDQIKIRDYRPYKKLSLAQRIQVIEAHKHLPNYQQLSKRFDCSAMQIKSIVASKDELLERYKSFRAQNINNCAEPKSYEEKLNFLGKVVFEYLLRAMNSRMPTDATVIRQKALEVKEALDIEDFTPDERWLHAFKLNSNRVDLMDLMEKLENDIEKRRSLDCNDIIDYIREQDREERRKLMAEDERIVRLNPTLEKLPIERKEKESFRNDNHNNAVNSQVTMSQRKTVGEAKDIRKTRTKYNRNNEGNNQVTMAKRKTAVEAKDIRKTHENEYDNNEGITKVSMPKRKTVVEAKDIRKTRTKYNCNNDGYTQVTMSKWKTAVEAKDIRKTHENEYDNNEGITKVSMPKRKTVVEAKDIRKTRMKLKTAARRVVQEHIEVNIKSEFEDQIEVKQETEFADDNPELTSEDSKTFEIIKIESINTNAKNSTSPEKPPTISAPGAVMSSYAEALRHLRKLENFAMNQEDYEALSLITHLEFIFRNSN